MAKVNTIILFFLVLFHIIYSFLSPVLKEKRKGKTIFKALLYSQTKRDNFILLILIFLFLYIDYKAQGVFSFNYQTIILCVWGVLNFYLIFWGESYLVMKEKGFFYGDFFIPYKRVSNVRLSEKGILMVDLEKNTISFNIKDIEDITKIYLIFLEKNKEKN